MAWEYVVYSYILDWHSSLIEALLSAGMAKIVCCIDFKRFFHLAFCLKPNFGLTPRYVACCHTI